jgi:toxin FitB
LTGWILDTNVISETRRSNPNVKVRDWLLDQTEGLRFTTVVSLAEIRFGISQEQNLERVNLLQTWLDSVVRNWFKNRILAVDETTILNWRLISRQAQKSKKSAPPADMLIAAIAITQNMKVATRDVVPFIDAGIPTLNPWTGERFNGA